MKIPERDSVGLSLLVLSAILCAWLGISGPPLNKSWGPWLYELWKDNQTFVAAMIALLAAVWAARPVYHQMRVQNSQAALDLLDRIERDIEAADAQLGTALTILRSTRDLRYGLDHYYGTDASIERLQSAISAFTGLDTQILATLAEGATIDPETGSKFDLLQKKTQSAQRSVYSFLNDLRTKTNSKYTAPMVQEGFIRLEPELKNLTDFTLEIGMKSESEGNSLRERARGLRKAADLLPL